MKIFKKEIQKKVFDNFDPTANIVLLHGDALKVLKEFPKGFVKLIITSPPYGMGKPYEKNKDLQTIFNEVNKIIKELGRVLSKDGSICWQVGNYVKNGEVIPLDILYYDVFKKYGFKLRNRIIWFFEHGLHSKKRFSGRYETILWFTKSDRYIFNLDSVRIPSKYPGKRYSKGKKKGLPSGNPNGKNPSDIWKIIVKDWETLLWNIPNVKARHPEKTFHPCQFPIELVERCVLALTNERDWVLDPFLGTGTSIIASIKNNRKAIGCEKEKDYINLAKQRISNFFNGNLSFRQLGKEIYVPKKNEKVARIPEEWK